MAEAVLAVSNIPDQLGTLVQRKAEGNPFFVEEMIKSLRETGVIRQEGESWVLDHPIDEISVPDTIQGVLMSRIDHLAEEPRRTLQLASVIGREFTQRLLDRIVDIRESTSAALRDLQAIELIYEKALYPELAFMFKHALTQDVAYGSLLAQRRRELHRAVAGAIEELYTDQLGEQYAVLGHHFVQAEEWQTAASYFEKAADRATAAFAVHEALSLCDQALAALEKARGDNERARKRDLHARKAALFPLLSNFARAHAEYEMVAKLSHELTHAPNEGSSYAGMAMMSFFAHEFDRSVAEAGRAVEIGKTIKSDQIVAAATCSVGWVQAVTEQLDAARESFELAREMSRAVGDGFHHSISASLLSQIANWRGDFAASTEVAEEALDVAYRDNSPLPLLIARFAHGLPLTGRGQYDDAFDVWTEGLALADKLGEEFWRNRFLNCLGWLHAECGDLKHAIELNQDGLGDSREKADPEIIANCELNIGDASMTNGEFSLARELFEDVHGLARNASTSEWMKWRYSQHLFASLGEVWLSLDHPSKAESFCNQCLDLASRTTSKKYLVRGWRLKGAVSAARLQWEDAEEAWTKALLYAREVGNPTQLWKTHLACAQLYQETGRRELMLSSLRTVRDVLDGIGSNLATPTLLTNFRNSPSIRDVYAQCETD